MSMQQAEHLVDLGEVGDLEPVHTPRLHTTWTVHVHLSLPSDTACRALPSAYIKVDDLLEGRGPGTRQSPDAVEVWFGVEGRDPGEALAEANRLTPEVIELLDPDREAVVTVSLSERPQDVPMEYVGMGEVAAIMGVTKQRIYQLAQRKDFPQPAFRLKATPVWKTADIYKFRRNR
jgi:predicted DNA-binding transcriptional regulator AlpA